MKDERPPAVKEEAVCQVANGLGNRKRLYRLVERSGFVKVDQQQDEAPAIFDVPRREGLLSEAVTIGTLRDVSRSYGG